MVKSGDYTELNPVTVPRRVAVVGDSLRTVTVRPFYTDENLFYVNNGCYLTGMTFRDHVDGAAAVAFNPDGSAGVIFTSPYIQNCSSITTTGTGIYIDGSVVEGLKSMVTDSYTQFNQGGIGIHLANRGYAQLVSIFTICCDIGFLVESGATCSISNSNCAFGNFGLKANGIAIVDGAVGVTDGVDQAGTQIVIGGLQSRPVVNDVVSFDEGVTYYKIVDSTELISQTSTVTLDRAVEAPVADETPIQFYAISVINASGHTFEFVGTGTDILTATPRLGGIPIQENEVVEVDGGEVYYTSTDQRGDFRVGNDFVINEADGTITGETFDRSLFAILTPYILAIEG